MKYIVFTFDGVGLPIAYNLQNEGHDVTVGQVEKISDVLSSKTGKEYGHEDPHEKELRLSLYDGMLEKMPAMQLLDRMKRITNPQDYFVFFDMNNLFKFANEVQKMGFHGNFPTEEDYLFEQDRDAAKEFVKKNYPKLNIAEVKDYTKVSEAAKFIKESDEIWVIKGRDENAETFVPDSDDIELARSQSLEALETYKEDYEKAGFILELMIPSVVEITPEKLYYDGVPIATIIDIENKSLGSGNLSIQTGCSGDMVFPIDMKDKINEIAFPPIVDEMARNHKGLFYWDASILINKKTGKMYFGEFCANRPGYNCLLTELAQCQSVNQYFENATHKLNPFTMGTVATSMRFFNLHRSSDDKGVLPGVSLAFKPEIQKDLWMFDVVKKGKKFVSAGYDWNLAVMTGSGNSINEAVQKMYNNIDKFSFMGAYYRPKSDYLSLNYPTSIINRLNYGIDRKLYNLPFTVKVGEIR